MTTGKAGRPGRGRAARLAARAAPPRVNPAPPGPRGGQYRPLGEEAVRAILDAAFAILENVGLAGAPPDLAERAVARGAHIAAYGRLCFPRGLVEEVVAGAARRITLHGRAPGRSIEVGGERVWFGTGGAAIEVIDLDSGRWRPARLADLREFARLADALDNIAWFTRCVIATDIADVRLQELATALALIENTTKPVGMSFTHAEQVAEVVAMFDIALGGAGAFAAAPCLQAHVSPVVSPLTFGADAVAVARACTEHGVPVNAIIAAQAGATAPAPLAGMLAQSTAETLAGLIMVNLFAPGHPVIFSNWPFVVDLRSGAFAGSGGESTVLNAAAAQIGRALDLPTGVAAAMADSKTVDAQMGAEKAMSALAAGLAGANMVFEAAGMMGSLMGASAAAMVADDEMLGQINRILRGVEVTPDTLGLDVIAEIATGPGHFLGHAQTLAAMERDYLYPHLADRRSARAWEACGAQDLARRATERARELLARRHRAIDPAASAAIRARFPELP